jgi:hypothetical protein
MTKSRRRMFTVAERAGLGFLPRFAVGAAGRSNRALARACTSTRTGGAQGGAVGSEEQ